MISFKDVLEGAMLHSIQRARKKGEPINDYFVYEAVKDICPKTHDVYAALLRLKDLGYVLDDSVNGKALLSLSTVGENYTDKLTEELSQKANLILNHLENDVEMESIHADEDVHEEKDEPVHVPTDIETPEENHEK